MILYLLWDHILGEAVKWQEEPLPWPQYPEQTLYILNTAFINAPWTVCKFGDSCGVYRPAAGIPKEVVLWVTLMN